MIENPSVEGLNNYVINRLKKMQQCELDYFYSNDRRVDKDLLLRNNIHFLTEGKYILVDQALFRLKLAIDYLTDVYGELKGNVVLTDEMKNACATADMLNAMNIIYRAKAEDRRPNIEILRARFLEYYKKSHPIVDRLMYNSNREDLSDNAVAYAITILRDVAPERVRHI